MWKKGLLVVLCALATPAFAILDLNLTKGVSAPTPIAIVPFAGDHLGIAKVVMEDLEKSVEFAVLPFDKLPNRPTKSDVLLTPVWKKLKVSNTLLGGAFLSADGRVSVDARLYENVASDLTPLLFSEQYAIKSDQARAVAHHISDRVFEKLTGVRGVFSTRLAYVLKSGHPGQWEYKLMISGTDGLNAKPVLVSNYVIMSPAWSPDARKLAYVSFESHHPAVYITDIATGKRQLISKFQGINGAPAWAPDGKSIVLVLSKSGTPNLYRYNLKDRHLTQITFDDWINTEPSFAPDGQSLLFTSNRDGGPQIYEYNFARQKISRVSYIGNYNARATFTPDGEHIVFLHRDQGEFTIAWQDLSSGEMKLVVKADVDESPSLAPNGEMVVYSSRKRGFDVLKIASVNGRTVATLPTGKGSVQEPAWAPFKG